MAEKEDREEKIIEHLIKKARELQYGELSLILTIHNGRISKGEIEKEKISL